MAKRTLLENESGIVFINGTAYLPLLAPWREIMEKNNIGMVFEKNTHCVKERLMENSVGQIYFEAWFGVRKDAKPAKVETWEKSQ